MPPPRLWSRLLAWGLRDTAREFVLGDLDEEYAEQAARFGPRHARAWYRRQALRAVLALPRRQRPRAPRRGDPVMKTFLQDVRYGVRSLVRAPGFGLVVILTLALAIGANTVIFSLAAPLVIRPLPLEDPDTLIWLYSVDPRGQNTRGRVSYPDVLDWRAGTSTLHGISAWTQDTATLTGRGDALRLQVMRTTDNHLTLWGIPAARGRTFLPGDDRPGAPRVVVLSHRFWQRQLMGDEEILGETIMLDGTAHRIVGVLSASIEIGNLTLIDAWTPLTLDPLTAPRDLRILQVAGRMKPGVTVEQALADVQTVSGRLAQDHPATNEGWSVFARSTQEAMVGNNTMLILALLGLVVTLVLAIACANLANLMLARMTDRQRELAIRTALGASRGRMVRQLLTENTLLGLAGGLGGLLVGTLGLRLMKAAAYEPFFELVVIDRTVLLFTAVIALLTPVLFSVLPAWMAAGTSAGDTLKEAGTRSTGGVRARRARSALVVSQLSLALMLLVLATLLVRTMVAMTRVDLGFDTRPLLTFLVDLPDWRFDRAERVALTRRTLDRLAALPGVEQVGAIDRLPQTGGEATGAVTIEGHEVSTARDQPWSTRVAASPTYFAAAGIPLVAGRLFTDADADRNVPVALVSREMVRRYWTSAERAIGSRVRFSAAPSVSGGSTAPRAVGGIAASTEWFTVIGVVADTRPPDPTQPPNPQVYVPLLVDPPRTLGFVVRASDPEPLVAQVRAAMRGIDPEVPVYQLRTFEEALKDELSTSVILLGLFVSFAVLALVLASAGLYGVISYSISQRTQEFGVRMAIGASPGQIRSLVLRQGARLLATGTVLGVVGGAALAYAIRSLLFGVEPADPFTYVLVSALLAAVATLAAWIPARRAMSVDPIQALRPE